MMTHKILTIIIKLSNGSYAADILGAFHLKCSFSFALSLTSVSCKPPVRVSCVSLVTSNHEAKLVTFT